jgi:hypothetical protein
MKNALFLAVLAFASISQAKVYDCDAMQDADGVTSIDSPYYTVEMTDAGLNLITETGGKGGSPVVKTTTAMDAPSIGVYQADGVTATLTTSTYQGKTMSYITLSTGSGDSELFSTCR